MYRSAGRLAVPVTEAPDVVSIPDRSGMLYSLEAVRSKVREIDDEYVDAVLQLITKCALSLTGASGAALALFTDDKMICRARAGETAPLLGAPVDIKQGSLWRMRSQWPPRLVRGHGKRSAYRFGSQSRTGHRLAHGRSHRVSISGS